MKTLCMMLVMGFVLFTAAARGDDSPPPQNSADQPEGGVDVNVLGGIRVRVNKPGDGSKRVRVNAPGVRVGVGNDGDGPDRVGVDAPGVRVRVGERPAAAERQTYLGLFVEPVPQATAAQLGELLKAGEGLIVSEVLASSPAEKAGVKQHDILVTYDGKALTATEQLRGLIRADKPGRAVKVEFLRSSKRYSLHLIVGERTVTVQPASSSDEKTPVSVRIFGREVIVGRHGVDAPGAVIRWGTPAEVAETQGRPSTCSVTVDRRDGATWNVAVTYTGNDGKGEERRLEGTSDEIRSRLDEFPPTVGDQVRRSLDRAESEKAPGKTVRVSVQPRVQGNNRGLHVSVQRPGHADGTRIFEFDHVFGGEKTVKVDDLLEVKVLAGELKELTPAVREQVEETLREVEIPEVRVEVRNSL